MARKTFVNGGPFDPADANDLQSREPVGVILPYAGTTAPTGFLICDGSTFNATTYADLNTLLGGNTLPDLRGAFLVGYKSTDTDYNAIGKTGGEKTHALSVGELPVHDHALGQYGSSGTTTMKFISGGGSSTVTDRLATTSVGDNGETTSLLVTQTGSGTAHENRPPFYTVNYIIRAI